MKEQKNVVKLEYSLKTNYFFEEGIKALRTNIQFCGRNIKSILFTSSMPDEGKSNVSFAYAVSQAQLGLRVLFIDTDIRKSVLAFRFDIEKKVYGLSDYLTGHKKLEEILYQTDISNLDVIFSGSHSLNPVELLEDVYFDDLMKYAADRYDCVVLDSAPLGSVIDAAIVAKRCDGAVIVVESGAISYKLLQKVKDQLEMSGCRLLGVVLNKVKNSGSGYYTQYGKYGKYGSYGKYGKYGKYYSYGYGYGDEKTKEEKPVSEKT